jgi:hypothetical protein
MCGGGIEFCLFLLFSYWIWELFQQCAILFWKSILFFFKIPPLFSIFDVQQIQIQIQIFVFPIKEPFLSGRTIKEPFLSAEQLRSPFFRAEQLRSPFFRAEQLRSPFFRAEQLRSPFFRQNN